jgi:hypothetical protein
MGPHDRDAGRIMHQGDRLRRNIPASRPVHRTDRALGVFDIRKVDSGLTACSLDRRSHPREIVGMPEIIGIQKGDPLRCSF